MTYDQSKMWSEESLKAANRDRGAEKLLGQLPGAPTTLNGKSKLGLGSAASLDGETHSSCNSRIKNEGGKARCCSCVPHEGCDDSKAESSPKQIKVTGEPQTLRELATLFQRIEEEVIGKNVSYKTATTEELRPSIHAYASDNILRSNQRTALTKLKKEYGL